MVNALKKMQNTLWKSIPMAYALTLGEFITARKLRNLMKK